MDLIKHAVKLKTTDVRPRVLMYLYDDQGRVLASQAQEGHDSDQKNWKFPGGGIEPGQSINEAARREALEEAGYQALTTHGVGSRPKLTMWPDHFREKAKKKKGRDFKAQRTYFRAGKIGDQQRDLLGADNDALKGLDMVPIATLIKDLEASSSDSDNPYAIFDVAKLKGLRALKERLEKTSSAVELATLTLDSAFVDHMRSKLAEEESTSRALKAIPMDPPLMSSKSLLKELSHLSNMMSKPTLSLEFAEEVDRDLTAPFRRLLETIGKADEADPVINKLVRISSPVILKLKESFGRLRPEEQAAELGVPFTAVNSEGQMYSGTGEKTPSYPSGHSMQSRLLSLALGQMYPEIKDMLDDLAAAIGKSRLEMGVHFPSDHEYGCRAAEALFDHMDALGSEKTSGVKKKYQNPEGGLNRKGRAHFKRTEGANLKRPVSKKQAKKSPKSAKRRKSFCARMGGMKKKHNIDCSKTPDKSICKALRKWDC